MILIILLYNNSKTIHNLLNFQETFLVDTLSNGANHESRCCVVLAVASMKKKKKEDEQFPKLTKHIYHHARREQVFVGCFMYGYSRASIWCKL